MADALTDEEKMTLKTAAFGAVFLVSNADPGLLAMVRESFAASSAIAGSTGLVRQALTAGPLPRLPDTAAAVAAVVLPGLRRSVQILAVKAPDQAAHYRETVLFAAEEVAKASGGVHRDEAAMIAKIRHALAASDGASDGGR